MSKETINDKDGGCWPAGGFIGKPTRECEALKARSEWRQLFFDLSV
jgi:hypothetical protein